ncbi:cytochrome c-type biogenesis protein [Hyphomicrobium sp. CS1BSMeth3]|uniref:cytochrome c-type biogenesis protein n=1 Tax=Hyphomicrobium sp. CS1BSMeth3 TaxID=1892844 RepID=UPI0009308EA6|nr:cytochrome c-type biogenesis protein [Hyphomicrobium sp. CS1BSMeth3]
MRFSVRTLLLLSLLLLPGAAHAVQPNEVLKDPALEARARALSAQLRCLVCQNQSIDDSDAPLAKDLRLLVRERLVAGDSDQEVTRFLVARYGEFVLLRPPLSGNTLLLWLTPLLLLAAAAGGIGWRLAAARKVRAPPAPLTADEQRRLAGLLKEPPAEK